MAKRGGAAEHEVVAPRVVAWPDRRGRKADQRARDGLSPEPGGVDDQGAMDRRRILSADEKVDASLDNSSADDWRAQNHRRPSLLGIALQGGHQAVRVDDSGGGTPERSEAEDLGLQRAHVTEVEQRKSLHTVFRSTLAIGFKRRDLLFAGRDYQLARPAVPDTIGGNVRFERAPASHAEASLE